MAAKQVRLIAAILTAIFAFSQSSIAQEENPPPNPPTVVETGHSAMWFAPERDGEGWVLEVLDDERATLTWFTYDDAGAQRWLYSLGSIVKDEDGQHIDFPELRANRGGRFGEGFDPDAIETEIVGSLTLRFADCHNGQLEYAAYGHAQTIDIQRVVSRTMASGCAPIHGVTGEPIHPLAAQSGNWFDPTRNGEGFELQWTATGLAVLSWYTYADDGSNRWLTGVGQREGEGEEERIVFPELYTTRGGRFGENYDPTLVERVVWGSLELAIGCDTGVASFASSLPEFGNGTRELVQLTRAVPAACPWVPPKLTDLYDIEYVELPTPPSLSPLQQQRVDAHSIANDGTVLGVGRFADGRHGVMLLRPGSDEWEVIGDRSLKIGGNAMFITPDGSTVYATWETEEVDEIGLKRSALVHWREDSGWEELPGQIYFRNVLYGMSKDGKYLVGTGFLSDGPGSYAWKWSEETGQVRLPISNVVPAGVPQAVSNDGKIVVGETLRFPNNMPVRLAVKWQGDGPPQIMHSAEGQELYIANVCNAACDLIFGSSWHAPTPDDTRSNEAWFSGQDGGFGYLGKVQGSSSPTGVWVSSDDGSIVSGIYQIRATGNYIDVDSWIWTQNTGMVSIRSIVNSELPPLDPARWVRRRAYGISSDGLQILFAGYSWVPQNQPLTHYRAAIFRLVPKHPHN